MTRRKQKQLLLIVLVLCFCTSCSKKDSQRNPPAGTNEVVLKAPFDKVGDFSCGLGFVQMGQVGHNYIIQWDFSDFNWNISNAYSSFCLFHALLFLVK